MVGLLVLKSIFGYEYFCGKLHVLLKNLHRINLAQQVEDGNFCPFF